MNRSIRRALGVGGLSVVAAALVTAPAQAAPSAAPVQDFLAQQLSTLTGVTTVLVHGTDAAGRRVTGRLQGPEAYRFTAMTAAAILGEVQKGRAEPGFKTPAQVFGSRFLDGFEGVAIRWEA